MTCLLNAIAGDVAIEEIEKGKEPDSLELGFEFGTWEYLRYYPFFSIVGGESLYPQNLNYEYKEEEKGKEFSEEAKKRIRKKLRDCIKSFDTTVEETAEKFAKKINVSCGTLHAGLRTKELLEHNCPNPLMLNDVKWYKKLLKIFSCKKVLIVVK